jgi:hypothetical protein
VYLFNNIILLIQLIIQKFKEIFRMICVVNSFIITIAILSYVAYLQMFMLIIILFYFNQGSRIPIVF